MNYVINYLWLFVLLCASITRTEPCPKLSYDEQYIDVQN